MIEVHRPDGDDSSPGQMVVCDLDGFSKYKRSSTTSEKSIFRYHFFLVLILSIGALFLLINYIGIYYLTRGSQIDNNHNGLPPKELFELAESFSRENNDQAFHGSTIETNIVEEDEHLFEIASIKDLDKVVYESTKDLQQNVGQKLSRQDDATEAANSKKKLSTDDQSSLAVLPKLHLFPEQRSQLGKRSRREHTRRSSEFTESSGSKLQISITPRFGNIRTPVGENINLKCLISLQGNNKFTKNLNVHWSRYMYDENVYEQIESFTSSSGGGGNSVEDGGVGGVSPTSVELDANHANLITTSENESSSSLILGGSDSTKGVQADSWQQFNRQQQLRDFLRRSRQEINRISDLLIEATLTISPVKASDNATYYCTASEGSSSATYADQLNDRARIDLVALSKPVVRLERAWPAYDSKSAIIQWLILSNGNAPIKRTILMVRNESTYQHQQLSPPSSSSSSSSPVVAAAAAVDATAFNGYGSPSVVVDSENNQWQRLDIAGDGEILNLNSNSSLDDQDGEMIIRGDKLNGSILPDEGFSRADVDVTSLGGGSTSSKGNYPSLVSSGRKQQQISSWVDQALASLSGLAKSADKRQRSFNLTSLLPGVTYNIRLAAINDMGQSNWTYMSVAMPNEVPAQISEIFLLSQTNDSLAIGWKRPAYDGAKTTRYEMQLFDLKRTITLDANINTTTTTFNTSSGMENSLSAARTNFMYIFVNLQPGTDYHFHVRACSLVGCGAFSRPQLLARTLETELSEPIRVELTCEDRTNTLSVGWYPPANNHGQTVSYSVKVESKARFLNQLNQWQVEEKQFNAETQNNITLSMEIGGLLVPNTNYLARVCANNRQKHCGRLSPITHQTRCSIPPKLPSQLPDGIQLVVDKLPKSYLDNNLQRRPLLDNLGQQATESLQLELPHISRRNGTIDCVQLVLIQLPNSYNPNASLDQFLPKNPADIRLESYIDQRKVGPSKDTSETTTAQTSDADKQANNNLLNERAFAYMAAHIDISNERLLKSNEQVSSSQKDLSDRRIVLGDGQSEICHKLIQNNNSDKQLPVDGSLKPLTYYTGFLKLFRFQHSTSTYNKEDFVMMRDSSYFEPVKTGNSVIEDQPDEYIDYPTTPKTKYVVDNVFHPENPLMPVTSEDFAKYIGKSIRLHGGKLYRSIKTFMETNFKFETITNYINNLSPFMQPLQIASIIIIFFILILLLIYLITRVPKRLRQKHARKLKKLQRQQQRVQQLQQQQQQEAANDEYIQMSELQENLHHRHQHHHHHHHHSQLQQHPHDVQTIPPPLSDHQFSNAPQVNQGNPKGQQHSPAHDNLHTSNGQQNQEVDENPQAASYGAIDPKSHERSFHHLNSGSKKSQQVDNSEPNRENQRRPSINVCQPIIGNYVTDENNTAHGHSNTLAHHTNHHHQQHHQHQCAHHRSLQQLADQPQDQNQPSSSFMNNKPGRKYNKEAERERRNRILARSLQMSRSIPLSIFDAVVENRHFSGLLIEEYKNLPRFHMLHDSTGFRRQSKILSLRPDLVLSRGNQVALVSGQEMYDASQVNVGNKRMICARSPVDVDSVWNFWRLVYEQDVSTIIMLPPHLNDSNEHLSPEPMGCAQYWPNNDNEETTIMSPYNDRVQKSKILPAKFKIKQETIDEDRVNLEYGDIAYFKLRRLTLVVLVTKAGENERSSSRNETIKTLVEEDEERTVATRNVIQLELFHWDTSSMFGQVHLIKFIKHANKRHLSMLKLQREFPCSLGNCGSPCNMLVHCSDGLNRSGIFAAMTFLLDELSLLLNQQEAKLCRSPKLNIFQLVSRLRAQREMLVSPFENYELIYKLIRLCIPAPSPQE